MYGCIQGLGGGDQYYGGGGYGGGGGGANAGLGLDFGVQGGVGLTGAGLGLGAGLGGGEGYYDQGEAGAGGGCRVVVDTVLETQYQEVEVEECDRLPELEQSAPVCRVETSQQCRPVTRQQCDTTQVHITEFGNPDIDTSHRSVNPDIFDPCENP